MLTIIRLKSRKFRFNDGPSEKTLIKYEAEIALHPPITNTVDLVSIGIKLARSENLPVLPQVVAQVLRVADDPNGSAKALERLMERDPAVTAKILKVANSSYYGHSQIPSVGRAISVLGVNVIRQLVIVVGFQQMTGGTGPAGKFDKIEYWKHSLAAATAARILGKLRAPMKSEELFSAGMMHDIGFLVMERFLAPEFEMIAKRATDEQRPFEYIMRDELGFDQAELGAILAERWNLTSIIQHAIRYHLEPMEDPDHSQTSAIVSAAHTLAEQCGFMPIQQRFYTPEFNYLAQSIIDMPDDQLEVIRNVMIQEVNRAQDLFQLNAAA